jgi:endonuclease YncB( thermonuclease family)
MRAKVRWTALGSAAALAWSVPGAAGLPGATVCPTAGTETVVVAAVEARLELRLRDGRLIRLAGLDPALSTPTLGDRDEQARDAFARSVTGPSLGLLPLATQPDRWGRITALAFTSEGPAEDRAGGLTGYALATGLGRYLAEPAAHACRPDLLAAEEAARGQKLGLWSDPYYGVLAVDDTAGFAERAGTIVVVEARVSTVQVSPFRTTLVLSDRGNGSHGGQTLHASILPRMMKTFEANGVHVSALTGQTLRLRGLLDTRFGPQIELATPDAIEVIDAGPTSAIAGSK